jgi:hypothetical protein
MPTTYFVVVLKRVDALGDVGIIFSGVGKACVDLDGKTPVLEVLSGVMVLIPAGFEGFVISFDGSGAANLRASRSLI